MYTKHSYEWHLIVRSLNRIQYTPPGLYEKYERLTWRHSIHLLYLLIQPVHSYTESQLQRYVLLTHNLNFNVMYSLQNQPYVYYVGISKRYKPRMSKIREDVEFNSLLSWFASRSQPAWNPQSRTRSLISLILPYTKTQFESLPPHHSISKSRQSWGPQWKTATLSNSDVL